MLEINQILKKNNLHPRKYTKKNKVIIVDTETGKYRIKEKTNNNKEILQYLKTRNFNYIPEIISEEENYEIAPYIENFDIPKEQKILDLIDLVSLLHNKTTHYKETTEDDYKEIYEDLNNNIEYLYTYYIDIITIIETKVYMSPSEYTLARNISKIFKILEFTKQELEIWYNIVKQKNKKRLVVLHNNLELDHIINNETNYLISWDKTKIDLPIFDIYKLYLKHSLEFEFGEILKRYEKNYPLYEDERKLFFILILLPPKIEFNQTEYQNTKKIGKMIDYLYKTENLISPYYSNKREENNTHK